MTVVGDRAALLSGGTSGKGWTPRASPLLSVQDELVEALLPGRPGTELHAPLGGNTRSGSDLGPTPAYPTGRGERRVV